MRADGSLTERVTQLIAPAAEDMGYELVRVRLTSGQRARLQVMAERADGTMTIEDCEALSRAVSALLDVADPIRTEYVLEVSSPGLDRPLVRRRDFERYKGHEAKIELRELVDGRRRFRGRLNGLEGDDVLLTDERGEPCRLSLAMIDDAKLVLTDELITATLKAQKKGQTVAADGVEMDVDDLEGRRISEGRQDKTRAAKRKTE